MFKKAVLELNKPEGAVLYNLTAFESGASAVLDRISMSQSGIYAWFRVYQFREKPNEFADDLMAAIRAPKFQSRTSHISPYYEIDLRSKSYIPPGKEAQLRAALNDSEFLGSVKYALESSLLFQAPLYVGKSNDLKSRIKQHLSSGSALKERLSEVGIDIEKTYLLIIPSSTGTSEEEDKSTGDSEADLEVAAPESLFEEIFSRLFNPSFTIRLG